MRRIPNSVLAVAAVAAVLVGVGAAFVSTDRAPVEIGPAPESSDDPWPGGSSSRPASKPAVGLPPVRLAPSAAQGPVPGLAVDPTAPDYDARKLIKLTGDLKAVYEAEPRNPKWAPAVEAQIVPLLERAMRSVIPNVRDVTMECKSTMCAINWSVSEPSEATDADARFAALQLFPGHYALSPKGGHIVRWDDLSWTGDIRDTDAFIGQARRQLERSADRLRNANLPSLVSDSPPRGGKQ